MRTACIAASLLVMSAIASAKSETARIEILHGKRPFVVLNADTAGQFTIWSGPGTSMTAADGTVSYQLPGSETATQKGPITIALFQNPAGLRAIGRNLFQITEASGPAVIGEPGGIQGHGSLRQGLLENSNVSVVQEFINMIVGQRTYEANARVVRAADEMYQEANALNR